MKRTFSASCFADYRKFIHKVTGITIASDRISMVEGRVQKRLRALKINSFEEYLCHVQANAAEQNKIHRRDYDE